MFRGHRTEGARWAPERACARAWELGTPIPASKEANPDRIRLWIRFIPLTESPVAALACWVLSADGATRNATPTMAAKARSSRDFMNFSARVMRMSV